MISNHTNQSGDIASPDFTRLHECFRQLNYATSPTEMAALVGSLPPRCQEVLRRRFSVDGSCPETLATIAADLGITLERVRQIEMFALNSLAAMIVDKRSAQ